MRTSRLLRAAALAAAVLSAPACGDLPVAAPPPPARTLAVDAVAGPVFESDVLTLRAVVRDAAGREVPGAPVAWSAEDPRIVEVAGNGTVVALHAGVARVTARSGAASAVVQFPVTRLSVQQVTVLPGTLRLASGDVTPVGVRVQGEGGRNVSGRAVTLATDDPEVAVVDTSGRVRAVGPGVTTLRATADGVMGTAPVEVGAAAAVFALGRLNGARLPILVAADSVTWNGVREYHEVYAEGGRLALLGGPRPGYELEVRYAEYLVTTVGGQRQLLLRHASREYDRGVVRYDARGDLGMTSEVVAPLAHTASPVVGGVEVRFRIPGEDTVLELFYRREPE